MKAAQAGRRIDNISRGEDIGLTVNILAITITTTVLTFTGSHCYDFATVASRVVLEGGMRTRPLGIRRMDTLLELPVGFGGAQGFCLRLRMVSRMRRG